MLICYRGFYHITLSSKSPIISIAKKLKGWGKIGKLNAQAYDEEG